MNNSENSFLDAYYKPKTELFIDDKLHLNQQGYAIWAEIIKSELNKKVPVKNWKYKYQFENGIPVFDIGVDAWLFRTQNLKILFTFASQ